MAQTGFTPISLYYTTTAAAAPTAGNLVAGELAINTNDGILYYKDSSGVVQSLASKAGNSGSFTNLAYTGTLTGGTGVVNLGSGQFYKDASGNIGVGTTSPTTSAGYGNLSLSGSTGGQLVFQTAGVYKSSIYSTATDLNILNGVAGNLILGTNGTERMRITSAGNVLPGADSTYSIGASGSRWLTINASTFSEGGAAQNFIQTSSTTTIFNGGSTWQAAAIYTNGSEAMRMNSTGNLVLKGGTTSASGVGVTFPATQSASSDANCLDDYEEGTWTPTDTSGAGLSFTVSGAQYVKVGQMVTAIAIFSYPATSNANACSIGGLPFSTNLNNSTGSILSNNAGAQKMICSGGTSILLFPVSSVNQSANITLSSANIYLSITYRCNN
jgi:hypothetical protein